LMGYQNTFAGFALMNTDPTTGCTGSARKGARRPVTLLLCRSAQSGVNIT
jgi:hypothetical protein